MFKKRKAKSTPQQIASQVKPILKRKIPIKPPVNIFGMVFFLTLGVVFVLNLLGIIPFTIWGIIWKFWPVYVVMFISQIFARKSFIARLIVASLGMGIVISIIFFSLSFINTKTGSILSSFTPQLTAIREFLGIELGQKLKTENVVRYDTYPVAEIREINITTRIGRLNIVDNVEEDHFVSNSTYYENYGKPNLSSNLEGTKLKIDFQTEKNVNTLLSATHELLYEISIGQADLPTILNISTQAGEVVANLNNQKVESLNLYLTAGSTKVSVGSASLPEKEFNIVMAAGNLRLDIPYDIFAEIKYDVGVGQLAIDNQKFSNAGTYITPKFSVTENPVPINIKLGAGTITINSINE